METSNNVLIDKWVSFADTINDYDYIQTESKKPIACTYSGHVGREQAKQNAQLIVTAVNACKQINAEHPIKVAEALPYIIKALKPLTKHNLRMKI